MTSAMLRYTLEEIEDIVFKGFDYQMNEDVMEKISNIAIQVGSPDYVKTPVFKKRDNPMKVEPTNYSVTKDLPKKRKGNKSMEVLNDEDWDAIRNFQTTKLETKTGIEADFALIRTHINKLTDKNYSDMLNKIVEVVDKMLLTNSETNLIVIGENIFDIASSNRYYSKIYADLYGDLSSKFHFIKEQYAQNLNKFTDLFNNIECVESHVNYDRFCEINKINEKRKSLATFYVNLMNNNIVSKNEIVNITRSLLAKVFEFISIENKKNEVEELTETIAILYKKELYENEDDQDVKYELIDGYTISEIINKIANSKVKDFKSLTNKALFKFMDLIDM